MIKSIRLHDYDIPYVLRRTRRSRSMRLSITASGLNVSAHPLIPEFLVRQFIRSKEDWVLKKLDEIKKRSKNAIQITTAKEKREIRDKALVSVLTKVKKWNEGFGFEINKISVKEQKSCWGSCTRGNNLHFNWKLGLMPDHLVDYVVVHELCHLQHFDHSRAFWALVETRIPDYKKRRKELNERGLQIT